MPELTIDAAKDREEGYRSAHQAIMAVLDGEPDRTARMATSISILAQTFPDRFFWTGYYRVDPMKAEELVVGPYQGTLGCLRIVFGRGVCGTAAATRTTQIVEDVHAHPNHIACDGATMSEIVVPVLDRGGNLIAVFDVDSTRPADFDKTDQRWLEKIMNDLFAT